MQIFSHLLFVASLSSLYAKECDSRSVQQEAHRIERRAFSPSDLLENGKATQKLNAKFVTLTADAPCKDGEQGCIKGSFAICDHGKYAIIPCGGNLTCYAMPLVLKSGTSLGCVTREIAASRIAATGATGGVEGDGSTDNDESTKNTTSSADSPMSQSNTTAIQDSQSGTGTEEATDEDEDESECEDTPF
ncbi:carbohydrate-binding module family 19 [Melampsora larici-populina 98AG31]|uniref:Carbohydrate-binding module family 19 n=1 Tax=Melampsora larici-populina (strain 98AG31 / pathotype 3-4-7) TaxID=747676 RepID=F4S0P2_MELLP|nr:carbohydrate-binding module family 19 [Melampsora larici-populina 98AG31]EGG01798.1 carbohydrate-binding module family 19 [Melampsora larici-populina 98AG31]